ncbi:MAG: phosphoglycerate kinase [Gemmataceae bacterium]|nr:phosphoglycerate kinase [Gemmataceae bacterium]
MKKTLADLPALRGKRVLVRVDFNVPLDDAGQVSNERRIAGAVPTLQALLDAGAAVIAMSHLGQPDGDPASPDFRTKNARLAMDRVAERLRARLSNPVAKADEVVGPAVKAAAEKLGPGELLLLENLRFHPGEKAKDKAFAEELASLADAYVNDAFGTCHRSDASMVAVPAAMKGKPRVVGKLVAKELDILDKLLSDPGRPMIGLLGGAKVSDKVGFIKALLGKVDRVLIGGAMTYLFLKAQGKGIGNSFCETKAKEGGRTPVQMAQELLELGKGKIVLPVDHLAVTDLKSPDSARVVDGAIPDGLAGVDIGPKTMALYQQEIAQAATVVWNGPMGKFEDEPYSKGTRGMAQALADARAVTVVGGGETAEAVEEFGLAERMAHVSTGGGAFLEYVEGTPFKALAEIDDR